MGKFFPQQSPSYVSPASVPQLSAHPNFHLPFPEQGEDLIQYTLRCAAALISPPQIEGEDEDTACEVVAEAVTALYPFILARWREHKRR